MAGGVSLDRYDRDDHFDGGWMDQASGVKNVLIKLPRCVLSWLHELRVINAHQAPYARTYDGLGVTKNFLTCAEMPYRVEKLFKACKEIHDEGISVRRGRDVIGEITNVWDAVQETIEVAYAGLSEEAALLLEKIGGPALGIGMVCVLWKDGEKIFGEGDKPGMNPNLACLRQERQGLIDISEEQRSPDQKARLATVEKFIEAFEAQRINTWIHIAQCVSYIALAVLLVATAFFAVAFAGWMTLACSTAALACSIIGHYHKEFAVEPLLRPAADGKGMTPDQWREYRVMLKGT